MGYQVSYFGWLSLFQLQGFHSNICFVCIVKQNKSVLIMINYFLKFCLNLSSCCGISCEINLTKLLPAEIWDCKGPWAMTDDILIIIYIFLCDKNLWIANESFCGVNSMVLTLQLTKHFDLQYISDIKVSPNEKKMPLIFFSLIPKTVYCPTMWITNLSLRRLCHILWVFFLARILYT